MADMELVEVKLGKYDFLFHIVRLPDNEVDDKLALVSSETGLICRMEYQNFLFTEFIVNLERLFRFFAETTGGDSEGQIELRNEVEKQVYEVNPILCPDGLLITKSGVIKRKGKGTPLTKNIDWERVLADVNPYLVVEEVEIVDAPEGFASNEEVPRPTNKFEMVERNWERPNLDLMVRKFTPDDLPFIFGPEISLTKELHYKIYIVQKCIDKAEAVFALCDAMGITAEVKIPILTEELYQICIDVNPFLKASEVDLDKLRSMPRQDVKRRRAPHTKKRGSGRAFSDVTGEELLTLAGRMRAKVVGQDEAIDRIVDTIQIASCGLRDPEAPIAAYLLCGTTGIGKTLCSKVLAEELCGSRDNIVRIDCSEYTQQHDVMKLYGCFVPGTSVMVEGGGVKAIEKISVGENVISHTGKVRPVIDTFEYDYKGPIYKINVVGDNRTIKCTPNHEFLVVKTKKCWYKNREHVVCKPSCGRNRLDYPCTEKLYEDYEPEWVMAKNIKRGDLVLQSRCKEDRSCPEVLDLAEFYPEGEWDDKYIWTRKQNYSNKVHRFIPINKDFVRLAGYYVAEGGVDKYNKRLDFSFHLDEKKYQTEVTSLIETIFGKKSFFHTPPHEQKINKKRSRSYIYSAVLRSLFKNLFGAHGSENKHLPKWWLYLSDNLLKEFLTTAVFGDGCTTVSRRVEYATVSPNLFSQIRTIFTKLGYITTVQKNKPYGKNWKEGYKIYISGTQVRRLQEELPDLDIIFGEIKNGSKGVVKDSNIQRMAYADDDYIYRQVKNIDTELYDGKVYDLHVDKDTSYQVYDIIAHNSPPSYVGYEDGGFLTNAIQSNPFSVILFDEIEKAHGKLFDILLQVMDDARLTDGKGTVTAFNDCVILMTSNIGVSESESVKSTMGFGDEGLLTDDRREEALKTALKSRFRPEFLNRIDDTINFRSLHKKDALGVVDLLLAKVEEYLGTKDIEATFTKNVKDMIFERGFSKKYGARPLQRVIDKEIIRGLAKKMLGGKVKHGMKIRVDYRKDKLCVREVKPRPVSRKNKKTPVKA